MLPIALTLVIALLILYSTPILHAISIVISNLHHSYVAGSTATFTIDVLLRNGERLPINGVSLLILGPSNTLLACQLPVFTTHVGPTSVLCSGGQTLQVTFIPHGNFGFNSGIIFGYGFGYGYNFGRGFGYGLGYGFVYGSGSYGYGYGYGYGGPSPPTSFTYEVNWPIPSGYLPGPYVAIVTLQSTRSSFIGFTNFNIVPTPTATALTPSNVILDAGQLITYNVLISGGVGPFTVNLVHAGNVVDTIVMSAGFSGNVLLIPTPPNTPPANTVSVTFNVIATDSGTTPPFVFTSPSNTITVNPAPTVSLTASSTSTPIGTPVTFTINEIGGSVGPFDIALFIAGTKQGSNVIIASPGGSNTITVYGSSINTFNYNVVATDKGTTTPYVFNSATVPVTFNPNPGGGITGPGGGVGGPGGGGNVTHVVLYNNETTGATGYTIFNFTEGHTNGFIIASDTFNMSKQFNVTINFITPTSVGVTINGHNYTLIPGEPQILIDPPSYAYYAKLLNISYLPILHKADIIVYVASLLPSANTTTSVVTTTIPVNTTATTTALTTTVPATTTVSWYTVPPSITVYYVIGVLVVIAAVTAGIVVHLLRKK